MTPQFKASIMFIVFGVAMIVYTAVANASSFRMCVAEVNKANQQVGCWKDGKWVDAEVWAKSLSPSCNPSIIEIIRGKNETPQIIKIHCKSGDYHRAD